MAEDKSYNAGIRHLQGGDLLEIGSTAGQQDVYGNLDIKSGGVLDIETGGTWKIGSVTVTPDAAELNRNDGITAGTVTGAKNLVPDASKDLASLRRLTVDQWVRGPVQQVTSTAGVTSTTGGKAAWTALASYGLSELSSSGSTGGGAFMGFSLAHPGVSGIRKTIHASHCSTAKPAYVEVAAAAQFIGGATGSTGSHYHRLAFNDTEEAVELVSASSVRWVLTSNVGSVTLTTNYTT